MDEVESLKILVETYRVNIAEKDYEVQQTAAEMGAKLKERDLQMKK